MTENHNLSVILVRQPWNKGKLIGAKPPLRSKHVWSIRTKLQLEGRKRDLALFNLALDSKLAMAALACDGERCMSKFCRFNSII
jgi:hypothetical protein